jgi:hypothetical protein
MNNDTLTFYLDNKILVVQKSSSKRFEKQKVDFKYRVNQNNYFTPEIIFETLDISNV